MSLNVSNESNQKLNIMYYNGIPEGILILIVLTLFVATPLFLAWYFIRRAKFKEKVTLIEKGIDIKDLNIEGNNKIIFPWLKIGIVLTGIGLGLASYYLLLLWPTFEKFCINQALCRYDSMPNVVVILSAGLSMIIANFVGSSRN